MKNFKVVLGESMLLRLIKGESFEIQDKHINPTINVKISLNLNSSNMVISCDEI